MLAILRKFSIAENTFNFLFSVVLDPTNLMVEHGTAVFASLRRVLEERNFASSFFNEVQSLQGPGEADCNRLGPDETFPEFLRRGAVTTVDSIASLQKLFGYQPIPRELANLWYAFDATSGERVIHITVSVSQFQPNGVPDK